jgi:hypothetical protein
LLTASAHAADVVVPGKALEDGGHAEGWAFVCLDGSFYLKSERLIGGWGVGVQEENV